MAMRFPAKSNLELHLDFQYLLIELFYIGMPLVRTVGRTGHMITKISRMDTLPRVRSPIAPYHVWATLARFARAWRSAIIAHS